MSNDLNKENKNGIFSMLWFSILLSVSSLLATYLIVDYKISTLDRKISNIPKTTINYMLETEYNKYGWKENYDFVNKYNLSSLENLKKQIEQTWTSSLSTLGETQINQAKPSITSLKVVDSSRTIASQKVTVTKDWLYLIWSPDAKVSVIEYSDLECPSCNKFQYAWIIEQLILLYWDKINFTYKHFPLTTIHPMAEMESEASECFWEIAWSDKFYTFIINTFANTKSTWSSYTIDSMWELSTKLWIDWQKIVSCINSWKYKEKIQNQISEWQKAWVKWTPSLVIKNNKTWNIKLIEWSVDLAEYKQEIDNMLK
jgi:protein-disulfide isomerase